MGNRITLVVIFVGFFLSLIEGHQSETTINQLATNLEDAPNIIVIYTDDQRWDTLCLPGSGIPDLCAFPRSTHPMPFVEKLAEMGITFQNAYASTPLCCPARASFLSGGYYTKHTNVLHNGTLNGSALEFSDATTLSTLLQSAGYQTALIGKYMNQYETLVDEPANTAYIPPGWDFFNAIFSPHEIWLDNLKFVIGSSTPTAPGTGTTYTTDGYITDVMRDQALNFLDTTTQPFYLHLAFAPPHTPAIPAPRHQNLYSQFSYGERGFGEQPDGDLSDKPYHVQELSADWDAESWQETYRNMLRSLRAVDEAVAAIVSSLKASQRFQNTIIIFTSDQGLMWGEHMLVTKHVPYEESIRTPLIIYVPGIAPRLEPKLVATNVDVPATILDIAGIQPSGDGSSLMPLILGSRISWRDALFFEFYDGGLGIYPSWTAVLTEDDTKYIEYVTGEQELYDLTADPFELNSEHNNPVYAADLALLAQRLSTEWSRGLAIRTDNFKSPYLHNLPPVPAGQPFSFQFNAWGGDGNYSWSFFPDPAATSFSLEEYLDIELGRIPAISETSELEPNTCTEPDWLTLQPDGLLSGTPPAQNLWDLCIMVTDTSQSPQPGNSRPMQHKFVVRLQAL